MTNSGTALALFLAALIALAGCGGGDTDPPVDEPSLELLAKWEAFEDGEPTLDLTDEQAKAAFLSAFEGTTHFAIDHAGPAIAFASLDVTVNDFTHALENTVAFVTPVMRHNDVFVLEAETHEIERGVANERSDSIVYGGWMDSTAFMVDFSRVCTITDSRCSDQGPVYESGHVSVSVFGDHPGTAPAGSGSATWNGVMVGMEDFDSFGDQADFQRGDVPAPEEPPAHLDVFLGDARITIDDLSDPDVDVAFTNIVNATQGTVWHDLTWNGLAIDGGAFGDTSYDDADYDDAEEREYIFGMFNGADHQEVGGHFRQDGIAGAFGAKRE